MANYTSLQGLLNTEPDYCKIVPFLENAWLDEYCKMWPKSRNIVAVLDKFDYLFDVDEGRLISSRGINDGNLTPVAREKYRQSQIFKGTIKPGIVRGHTIPRAAGGQLDINIVIQEKYCNNPLFLPLEKRFMNTSGTLYFTYWKYEPGKYTGASAYHPQRANEVDQGLLVLKQPAVINTFAN